MPKEGDICQVCKQGVLGYVRNDQNQRELGCDNPKCANSREGVSHSSSKIETKKSSASEHRDDNFQTMVRSRYGR
jgi:hypothetical protein